MFTLILFILILFLSILFRVAGFPRLTIPLLYALLLPILFGDWYHSHELVGNGIFFFLLGLVALSWVISLIRKIRR